MKYLKEYNTYRDIDSICKEYIRNYTINNDGSIDVDGDVYLGGRSLQKIPLNFNRVTGYFACDSNELTSLEGCPKEIGGGFYCSFNKLTSLEGCPKEVGGSFDCYNNQLTSLEGCPKTVGGNFNCSFNQLTSLKGCPKEVGGHFYCNNNKLPKLIKDNYEYIKGIIKWQDDYSIWRKDGSLDEFRFKDMMIDIKNDYK